MLRSIPLRLKLVTALVLPMLVVAGYLWVDVADSTDRRDVAAAQADEVAAFRAVTELSDAVGSEQLLITSRAADATQLAAARATTDAAYDALRMSSASLDVARLQLVDGHYGTLLSIREALGDDPTEARLRANIELRNGEGRTGPFSTSLTDLAELPLDVLSAFEFDPAAIDDVVTNSLVDDYFLVQRARADIRKESATLLRVSALPGNLVDTEVTESVTAVIAETDASLEVLAQLASIDVAGDIDSMLVAPAWSRYSGFRTAVDANGVGERVDIDEDELRSAANAVDSVLRTDADTIIGELETRANDSVFAANRDVIISGLIGLWLVVGVGLVLRFLYRAIKRPLEQLTAQAEHVANVELPSVIDQMRRGDIERVPDIDLIPAESKDEVGSLVTAFNDMHRSAVDLAAGQAESRRVVADMFVNLGRRNQRLVGRLLNGLSTLEQHEQDPDKLAALYDLDHTATRMRRNAESLLVLAGAGQARRWDQPVAIHDITRAAISEVENYQRVEIDVQGEERLDGSTVADVTHLLAELVENALAFSPPNSAVEINAGQTSSGYVIAISDHGIGMLPDAIEEANARITGAASEDESPSEFLGHYVVGRLGARHGIRVELTEGREGGVTAWVWIPTELVVDPSLLVPGEDDPATGGPDRAPSMPAPSTASSEPDAGRGVRPAPVDPLLAPLGGTGPTDTALPDTPPTPLQPSSDATDFLSSLEASGVRPRTSKLPSLDDGPGASPTIDPSSPAPTAATAAAAPAATPAPAAAPSPTEPTAAAPSPMSPPLGAAAGPSAAPSAPAAPTVERDFAPRAPTLNLDTSIAESLAALASETPTPPPTLDVAPPAIDLARPTSVAPTAGTATTPAPASSIAAPVPPRPAPIPSLTGLTDPDPVEAAAPMPTSAPAGGTAVESVAPAADVAPDSSADSGAATAFGSPRRLPGANMPKTELIGSIVGSMGSLFGDTPTAAPDAPSPSPSAVTAAPTPSTDGTAAASATRDAISAVQTARAAANAAEDPAPPTLDPDRIRSALSGFQQGTARAEQEGGS
ncbi:MAG: ATP-binding protein [Actinomycetota bacterium]